jgi:hypothetical protein
MIKLYKYGIPFTKSEMEATMETERGKPAPLTGEVLKNRELIALHDAARHPEGWGLFSPKTHSFAR